MRRLENFGFRNGGLFPAIRVLGNLADALSVAWQFGRVFYQVLDQKVCRHQTRSGLSKLHAQLLDDIGISEEQRKQELAKWFWQD